MKFTSEVPQEDWEYWEYSDSQWDIGPFGVFVRQGKVFCGLVGGPIETEDLRFGEKIETPEVEL